MVSPGVFPASADRLQFQNGDRHCGFCFLIVTAAAERTPAFLAFELGWARLGVGKSSGRRWGRIDEDDSCMEDELATGKLDERKLRSFRFIKNSSFEFTVFHPIYD